MFRTSTRYFLRQPSSIRHHLGHSTTNTTTALKTNTGISYRVAIPTGATAGMISALAGVGGGVLIIPMLARFTSLRQQVINGTSLVSVTIGATVGSASYLSANVCNIPIATILATSSLLTTKLGVKCAQQVPSAVLRKIVSVAMLCAVPAIITKKSVTEPKHPNNATTASSLTLDSVYQQFSAMHSKLKNNDNAIATEFLKQNGNYVVAGLASGFLSGLLGLGGGILMTSYLTAVTDMSQHEVVGTSLCAIVPIGIATSWHNLRLQNVHLKSAALIGSALSVSVYLTSSYVALKVDQEKLRNVFGTVLTASAFSMLLKP